MNISIIVHEFKCIDYLHEFKFIYYLWIHAWIHGIKSDFINLNS